MLYNKNNLIIAKLASKYNSREEFTGVYFKENKTVVTDSYSLIEVTNPDYMENNDNFPEIDGEQHLPKVNEIVPAQAVLKVNNNISKIKNKNFPLLNNATFIHSNLDDTVKIATTDLSNADIVSCIAIKEEYPDYEKIIPDDLSVYNKITVDVKRLKDIISILNEMNLEDSKEIQMFIKNESVPLLIKTKTKEEQEVTALLMPTRKD